VGAGPQEHATAGIAADPVASVDRVIWRLNDILEWASDTNSRIGYFAAVYRRVTVTIRGDIAAGSFADGARVAEFDVRFAQRFFDALDQHRSGEAPTESWRLAFEASDRRDLSVIQHLFLGINAHIRLDLGVVASIVAPGPLIAELRADFGAINAILVRLLPRTSREMHRVSPLAPLVPADPFAQQLIALWIHQVRSDAWRLAEELAPLVPEEHTSAVVAADRRAAHHARRLIEPDPALREVLRRVVAPTEDHDVAHVIQSLT